MESIINYNLSYIFFMLWEYLFFYDKSITMQGKMFLYDKLKEFILDSSYSISEDVAINLLNLENLRNELGKSIGFDLSRNKFTYSPFQALGEDLNQSEEQMKMFFHYAKTSVTLNGSGGRIGKEIIGSEKLSDEYLISDYVYYAVQLKEYLKKNFELFEETKNSNIKENLNEEKHQ